MNNNYVNWSEYFLKKLEFICLFVLYFTTFLFTKTYSVERKGDKWLIHSKDLEQSGREQF
jgi:hypothetical protein